MEGPRVGGVRLEDWCIFWPTHRALKTRSPSGLNFSPQKNIGASIRIGQEIRCLPYVGFFFLQFDLVAVRYDKQL